MGFDCIFSSAGLFYIVEQYFLKTLHSFMRIIEQTWNSFCFFLKKLLIELLILGRNHSIRKVWNYSNASVQHREQKLERP